MKETNTLQKLKNLFGVYLNKGMSNKTTQNGKSDKFKDSEKRISYPGHIVEVSENDFEKKCGEYDSKREKGIEKLKFEDVRNVESTS